MIDEKRNAMRKYLRMLNIRKEEMPLVGVLLVIFTALHVLVVRRFWDAFSPLGKDYWWLFVGKFDISGFDPITYSVLSHWCTATRCLHSLRGRSRNSTIG